jgi:hypothetical protein
MRMTSEQHGSGKTTALLSFAVQDDDDIDDLFTWPGADETKQLRSLAKSRDSEDHRTWRKPGVRIDLPPRPPAGLEQGLLLMIELHRRPSMPRAEPVTRRTGFIGFWIVAVFIVGIGLVTAIGYSSRDSTGQSASMGTTPTEQVKAPPSGTGSNSTTGTAPRDQEQR